MLAVSRPWSHRAVHCNRFIRRPTAVGPVSAAVEELEHAKSLIIAGMMQSLGHSDGSARARWATHAGIEHPLRSAVPLFPLSAEPAATFVPRSNKFHRLKIVTLLENFHASDHCQPNQSTQFPPAMCLRLLSDPACFRSSRRNRRVDASSPQQTSGSNFVDLTAAYHDAVLDWGLSSHQVPCEP